MITKKEFYKIDSKCPDYFIDKYGRKDPIAFVEGTDLEITGKNWKEHNVMAQIIFKKRLLEANLINEMMDEQVYCCKISDGLTHHSEFILESELTQQTKEGITVIYGL